MEGNVCCAMICRFILMHVLCDLILFPVMLHAKDACRCIIGMRRENKQSTTAHWRGWKSRLSDLWLGLAHGRRAQGQTGGTTL